jgi:hypothetical protein
VSSIKEKLRDLEGLQRANNTGAKRQPPEWSQIASSLEARIVSAGHGECLVRERCFALDYIHSVPLRRFFDLERDNYILITKQHNLGELAPHCIGFLDTETTGLAGGAGTYVFLIGLGYFSNKSFHIKQYFMRDYQDEQAMLSLFEKDIRSFSAVVSYNGKSYDIPALRTRYVLNRLRTWLDQVQQIDLLHSTRRLWKKELGSWKWMGFSMLYTTVVAYVGALMVRLIGMALGY